MSHLVHTVDRNALKPKLCGHFFEHLTAVLSLEGKDWAVGRLPGLQPLQNLVKPTQVQMV